MDGKKTEAPPAPANAEAAPPVETLVEAPRRRGGAQKRKAAPTFSSTSTSSSAPSKRLAKERNALHPLPPVHNGPVTRARQSPNKLAATLQNLPGPAPAPAAPGTGGREVYIVGDSIQAEEEDLMEDPVVDSEFDAVRSRGSNVHAVPTPAGWFSWNRIHPIEKHTMASFFNEKSENRTPDIYMKIRNFIMKKFHADPQTQVELKDLSELSVGDMDARQEVMEFLDHWGLVNFHPFLPSNPEAAISDANGAAETSSLIEKLYQFEAVQPRPRFLPRKADLSSPTLLPSLLPVPAIADDLVRPAGPSVEYHCNSCSADCSRKRYHCQKQADFDLCTECYNEGKFGSGMAAADFILMEPADAPGVSGGSWTDQETLLLLEALELFGQNWNEIAEHVATKTKAQCMLHFIQMPIEDPFLEGKDYASDNIQENMDPGLANKESASLHVPETKEIESAGDADEPLTSPTDDSKKKDPGESEVSCTTDASIAIDALKAAFQAVGYLPEQGGLLSFAEAGNPVMALAAFLVHLVEPGVATNSSRGSLKAMSEDSPGIQLATRHCFLLEDPPNDRKDPPSSESAVTDMGSGEAQKEEDQMPILDGTDESKDCIDKNEKNVVSVEKEIEPSISSQDCSQKVSAESELGDSVLPLETIPGSNKDSGDLSLEGEQIVHSAIKDVSDSALPIVLTPDATKESGDLALQGEDAPAKAKEINDSKMVEDRPNSLKESGDTSDAADTMPTSAPVEGQESQQTNGLGSTVESREKGEDDKKVSPTDDEKNCNSTEADDESNINKLKRTAVTTLSAAAVKAKFLANEDKKVSPNDNEKNCNSTEADDESNINKLKRAAVTTLSAAAVKAKLLAKDDKKVSPNDDEKNCNSTEADDESNINKLKRAAVTTLSAAAVKAKLLANQEEDQIRQLVSLVIEKQLQKLETKLALFTEMEGVIMRVREQIDRARQRLLHERAQIVAARLGLPASSLPTSKIALGYGTTVMRPLNMASQKPPLMRRP